MLHQLSLFMWHEFKMKRGIKLAKIMVVIISGDHRNLSKITSKFQQDY